MAERIKGISVEIGGETTGLDKALKGVNNTSRDLQKELKDVQRLLKFDPNNADLLAQRQKLLNTQIENTEKKLKTLKDAEKEVQAQFEKGTIGAEQYRAFQRELADTQSYLRNTQNRFSDLQKEQEEVQASTKELDRLFEITGQTVEDFADVIGNKTVRAIQQGTASSKDLKNAFDKIAQSSIGANRDVADVRKAIEKLESGETSINGVRKQFQKLQKDASDAKTEINELGGEIAGLAGAIGTGITLDAILQKALSVDDLNTIIDITMDVPEESKQAVKDAVKTVGSYIDDNETALNGVRKQFQLNADLTDEQNAKIVKSAGTISKAYSEVDFNELITETNEMSKALGISHDDVLGMTKSLLDFGFPADQLDIISEYGQQLHRAGYNAEEIQAIFQAGVETGTWNIDNLMDGLKEGRIRLAEFGTEVPKALSDALAGTDLSSEQFQKWGQSVAKGGEEGKQAMEDVATALAGVEDETKRNELGAMVFGTMWEEQGDMITDTILNAKNHTTDLADGQKALNDDVAKLDASPQQQMNEALREMWAELQPLLTLVIEFVTKIAEWIRENPTLTVTILAIISAIGILTGIFLVIMPIIVTLTTLATALGVGIGAIATPVLIVIGIIVALIAIGVLLWKNWDTIMVWAKNLGEKVGEAFSKMWKAVKEYMGNLWDDIKEIWGKVETFFTEIDLKQIGKDIIQGLINGISSMAGKVLESAKEIANGIGEKISSILKLGSPSRLMMEFGEYTGEGLAIGIKKSMRQVRDVASQLGEMAIPENLRPENIANTTSNIPSGRNVTVNINSPKALDVRDASREFNRTLNKMSLMW